MEEERLVLLKEHKESQQAHLELKEQNVDLTETNHKITF